MAERIRDYDAFWLHYLREHADPRTRAIHVFGTFVGVGLFVLGLVTTTWWMILLGIISGYAFAWISHMTIERNRPATFTYPLWSLGSDLKMAWLTATGRLDGELRRAGIG
ncbi:Mpo1-like protein [Roseomonas sp. CCTCC AB2023176]|uniref:Mpo1-like protein n=1 Tax=Roseomonas sp. CCTCC AB2023176 TaxID=3342640 RepID=UPI0035E35C87